MADQQIPSRLVFRIPGVAILAALLLAVSAMPIAFGFPPFAVFYVVPVAIIVWVVRVRTTADATGLVVRHVIGTTKLPWDSLKGLKLTKRAKVRAVTTADREMDLPCVRVRHLPALSLVSGGRLDDPTEGMIQEEPEDAVADEPQESAEVETEPQAKAPADAE